MRCSIFRLDSGAYLMTANFSGIIEYTVPEGCIAVAGNWEPDKHYYNGERPALRKNETITLNTDIAQVGDTINITAPEDAFIQFPNGSIGTERSYVVDETGVLTFALAGHYRGTASVQVETMETLKAKAIADAVEEAALNAPAVRAVEAVTDFSTLANRIRERMRHKERRTAPIVGKDR